jgi:hypothetical protein
MAVLTASESGGGGLNEGLLGNGCGACQFEAYAELASTYHTTANPVRPFSSKVLELRSGAFDPRAVALAFQSPNLALTGERDSLAGSGVFD